jgi:hypothetical protein
LPRCACGPVNGAAAPIFTTNSVAAAGAWLVACVAAGVSDLPQATSVTAHKTASGKNEVWLFMKVSYKGLKMPRIIHSTQVLVNYPEKLFNIVIKSVKR